MASFHLNGGHSSKASAVSERLYMYTSAEYYTHYSTIKKTLFFKGLERSVQVLPPLCPHPERIEVLRLENMEFKNWLKGKRKQLLPSHCRFSFFVYFPFGTCLFFPRTIKHRKQTILNIFNHKYDTCTTYQHNIKINNFSLLRIEGFLARDTCLLFPSFSCDKFDEACAVAFFSQHTLFSKQNILFSFVV